MTIEKDETTATKLASVSERLEAVEVRDALTTCAHQNAHRALSDLEDLNERVMALAEAVGDVDRVTETALGELIAVAGQTATDVTELARVTADEIAGERRKREELERAVNALRAKVRSVAQWEPVPKEDLQRVWHAIAEVRSDRDDTHTLAASAAGTQRYQGRQIEELRSRLNGQDEEIRTLRSLQEDATEALRCVSAYIQGQQRAALGGDLLDERKRQDMIVWMHNQSEAITALSGRVVALEDERVVAVDQQTTKRLDALTVQVREMDERTETLEEKALIMDQRLVGSTQGARQRMDKLALRIDGVDTVSSGLVADAIQAQSEHARQLDESVSILAHRANETEKRVDTVTVRVAELEEHEHPAISYGVRERIDGVERQAHKRMDNLATRLTELERRAR